MEKDGKGKKSVATEIEKNFNNVLNKIKSNEKDTKELESIKIVNASEVALESNKHCYLVQVECSSEKDLKKVNQLLVKKFEEHFSTPVVIIPAKKRINGNLYQKYQGTKVPRDRTLSAVFDAYLDDLVFPATIVGKRIRFPKGKVRHFKVLIDNIDKEVIEYKVPSITACYKALTNRDLQVEILEKN